MTIYYYNNTKRLNSTAAAPATDGSLDCVLKNNTSLLDPILVVNLASKPAFNYFLMEDRYYRVTDIVSVKDQLWEIHGTVDPLTTFRSHILNTTAFVLYDSTANTQIPDGRLAIKTDCDTYIATAKMPWNFDSNNGTYFICTTGCPDEFDWQSFTYTLDSRNGTGVYMIPENQINQLGFDVSDMTNDIQTFTNTFTTAMNSDIAIITQTAQDFFEYIGNAVYGGALLLKDFFMLGFNAIKLFAQNLIGGGDALKNIKACYWLPFEIPSDGTYFPIVDSKPLALGTYEDQISGIRRVKKAVIESLRIPVSIPWHFSDWRNVSCTEIMLYIPLIGCINIPPEVVKGNNQLDVKIALNLYSGAMAAEVRCDGAELGTYGCNTAMPYMVGDSNMNIAAGVVNTVAAGASSNALGVAAGLSQIMNPMASSVGGIGGGAGTGLTDDIVCICRVHDTSQTPSTVASVIGTPTNQLKALTTSLGYCQCLNAQLNCAAQTGEPNPTQKEIEMINSYLNTGVYLE